MATAKELRERLRAIKAGLVRRPSEAGGKASQPRPRFGASPSTAGAKQARRPSEAGGAASQPRPRTGATPSSVGPRTVAVSYLPEKSITKTRRKSLAHPQRKPLSDQRVGTGTSYGVPTTFNNATSRSDAPPLARSKVAYPNKTAHTKLRVKSTSGTPTTGTPPMPIGKPTLGFRVKAALRTGKDNQALAKSRMLAASRKN